jgi:hypothetical protein
MQHSLIIVRGCCAVRIGHLNNTSVGQQNILRLQFLVFDIVVLEGCQPEDTAGQY